MDNLMQRENEIRRIVLEGRRTDDRARCSVVVIHEIGGTWAFYPHGAAQLGVRLSAADVTAMAQAIQDGTG